MSDINFTPAEVQRFGEQEDPQKSKGFLISALRWSLALLGVKDFLLNKQAVFITIAVALILLFGISLQTIRGDGGKTLINFTSFILGCLVVGVAIDSIVLNSFVKLVIYCLFLVMVATNPNYQQIYPEMKRIFKSICGEISMRFKNLFIQSHKIIKKLLKINVADREESSMNNHTTTQHVGGDGGGVGEDIV